MIVIAFPVAFFVQEPPGTGGPRGRGAHGCRRPRPRRGATGAARPSLGAILRRPAFYLLAIGSMASIGAVGGTMQNLKLYLAGDRGLSQGEAATVLSLVLFGSLAGRLLMGWLADRWPRKYVMLLIYLIVAASIPLLVRGAGPGHAARWRPSCSGSASAATT